MTTRTFDILCILTIVVCIGIAATVVHANGRRALTDTWLLGRLAEYTRLKVDSGRATEREIRFGQSDALHRMAEDLRFDVCVRYGCVHDGIPFDDAGVDLYLGMAKVFDEVAECVRPEIP